MNWHFRQSYLQVYSVAVLLCGSKVLCIVARLHMIVSDLHVYIVPDLERTLSSAAGQPKESDNLEEFAVGRPQGDEGHLARVRVDLLDQQGELGCPVFPVLYLNLDIKST